MSVCMCECGGREEAAVLARTRKGRLCVGDGRPHCRALAACETAGRLT